MEYFYYILFFLLISSSCIVDAEEEDDVEYKAWEPWSRCSKTCGVGLRQRRRKCASDLCIQTQQQTCTRPACRGEDSVEEWPEWSACSTTCGRGTQTRIRQCPVGNCRQKQTKMCYNKPCPEGSGDDDRYHNWEKWSSCSATCGKGKMTRIRKCKDAPCKETEVSACTVKRCPGEPDLVLGEWRDWGPCSKTCGDGRKERKRFCENGDCEQSQSMSCRIEHCPGQKDEEKSEEDEYYEWEAWGPCSVTCGYGRHKRRRRCVEGFCEQVMTHTCFVNCSADAREKAFHPWRPWSACSATCGSGERHRIRECKGASCRENQAQTCFIKACPGGKGLGSADKFHKWGDWSACSVTCGEGKQERKRRCLVGRCMEVAERTCREARCPGDEPVTEFEPWTSWSACSATCGPGEAKKTRRYSDGSNEQVALKFCEVKRCKDDNAFLYRQWGTWEGCTVTCGTGIWTRVRKCKVGDCQETETARCERGECGKFDPAEKYSNWLSWGPCSKTCGFGITVRKRYCRVGTCEHTGTKTCRLKACPRDYTEWEDWGPCSVTCGTGTSIRKRFCVVGICEDKQQTACDMEKCGPGWEEWQEWKPCSQTCGDGFSHRIRKCKEKRPSPNCPGANYDYGDCNLGSCGVWSSWGDWNECLVTCGTSTVTRIRVCQEGQCEGDDKQTKQCSTTPCVKARWSDWTTWSKCSKECGKGESTRERECIGGKQWDSGCLGSTSDKKSCTTRPCIPAKWSKWTKWLPCPVSCGTGLITRKRVCINGIKGAPGCQGDDIGSRVCQKKPCITVKWGPWSPWNKCAVTCGWAEISRTRTCIGGAAGEYGCLGDVRETKECGSRPCPKTAQWKSWSDWSECPVTCGTGTVTRTRECDGKEDECKGSDNDVDICTRDDCIASWGQWSAWNSCSASCGLGLTLRVRSCNGAALGGNGCDEGGQETKECLVQECDGAQWESWSEWSECPVTCDRGTQSRARICRKGPCPGDAEEIRYCNTGPCKPEHWSDWTRWSECTATCGLGTRYRTRTCVGGTPGKGGCPGSTKMIVRCRKRICIVGVWKGWEQFGPCSVTCGKGTKFRIRECEGGIAGQSGCAGLAEDVVECSEKRCPFDPSRRCPRVETPTNGEIMSPITAANKIGTILLFGCNSGYESKGSTTIECLDGGIWSGPVPNCAALTCERDLSKVEQGHKCSRACKRTAQCRDPAKQCLCDGWCGKTCYNPDKDCEKLPIPKDGYILGMQRTYGYSVTYGCNDGYMLSGLTTTRICRSDLTWSGQAPKCLPYSATGLAGNIGDIFKKQFVANSDSKSVLASAWPWQAMVLVNNDKTVQQTFSAMLGEGSIINNKWIMTAAHTLDESTQENNWKQRLIIALGMTTIPRNYKPPNHVQFYEPAKVLKHVNFDAKNYDYDVALIKVGSRLTISNGMFGIDKGANHGEIIFGEHVRPVALPCISACDVKERTRSQNGIYVKPYDEKVCREYGRLLRNTDEGVVVTGYGATEKDAWDKQSYKSPSSLKQAFLKLFATQECIDGVREIRQQHKDARYTGRMLCAGSLRGRDACLGGSGGPLTKRVSTKDGDTCWVQLGIISWRWGCANGNRFGSSVTGYYTDISSVMQWVVDVIKKY